MQVYIFIRKGQPDESSLRRYIERLKYLRVPVISIEADSDEGIAKSQLYDLVGYPATIVTSDNGSLMYQWQDMLPDPEELGRITHL